MGGSIVQDGNGRDFKPHDGFVVVSLKKVFSTFLPAWPHCWGSITGSTDNSEASQNTSCSVCTFN